MLLNMVQGMSLWRTCSKGS